MPQDKRFAEELLLMGGCPNCGQEVNETFVRDTIDRIVEHARQAERGRIYKEIESGEHPLPEE